MCIPFGLLCSSTTKKARNIRAFLVGCESLLGSMGYNPAMESQGRISVNPAVRSGKPCVKGTRVTVCDVLECLAGGMPEDAILSDFSDLTRDDIRAALAFAAARERRLASA